MFPASVSTGDGRQEDTGVQFERAKTRRQRSIELFMVRGAQHTTPSHQETLSTNPPLMHRILPSFCAKRGIGLGSRQGGDEGGLVFLHLPSLPAPTSRLLLTVSEGGVVL